MSTLAHASKHVKYRKKQQSHGFWGLTPTWRVGLLYCSVTLQESSFTGAFLLLASVMVHYGGLYDLYML